MQVERRAAILLRVGVEVRGVRRKDQRAEVVGVEARVKHAWEEGGEMEGCVMIH